jgi:3-hydroxyacyl-[acyl-carrier-protein] dehydratase
MQLERFRMITGVAAVDLAARRITCVAEVPHESPVFEGHFPGLPLLPGTLMIETIAQAGGMLIYLALKGERMPFLIQVEMAKIRDAVTPGTRLDAEAELVHDGSGYAVTAGRLARAGRLVAEAQIRYRVAPFPNDALRDNMREAARGYGLS